MWIKTGCRVAATWMALFALAPAGRAGTWTNHIDASMTHEIVQHDNLLYMATYGGVLVFDPATGEFTQFRNDSGLPSNGLRCLVFDEDDDIYIGTEDIGIAKVRIANGRLTLQRALSEQIDGLASNAINSIAVWGDVIVYGSTPGAGTLRNDFASARFFERDGLPGPDVHDVLPMDDLVYMATSGGVATLNALGIIETLPGTPANTFVLGTDGSAVWVGTNDGVRRYDPAGGTWTDLGLSQADAGLSYRIRSFYWSGTSMWAGASRHFMRYTGTGKSWNIISPDSIQNRYALDGGALKREMKGLSVLPNGHVYLGTAGTENRRGPNLMRYDGTTVVNLKPNTPGANFTRRLDVDIDGSLWASFSDFYVGKLAPDGRWINYNTSIPGIELPTHQNTNIAFLADSQGHKWFSSLSLLDETRPLDELDDRLDADFDNDVWVRHPLGSGGGDGYGTLRPQRAAEDPVGNRWFLSDDYGAALGWQGIHILSRDGSAWFQMTPTKDPAMVSGNVVDVAFASSSTYVAFLNAGVYQWSHGGFTWPSLTNYAPDDWTLVVSVDDLPSDQSITRLALRSDRRLWVGTTAGLFYLDDGELKRIPTYAGITPGVVSAAVQDIVLDHDENLWVATELGLNRIARDDDNDIETFLTTASFVALSGLRYPLDVISPLAHADCRSLAMHPTDDVIYIGTFGGISAYDFSAPPATETDLSAVYVYPNPVYASKGHDALRIANLTGPVTVEVYTLEGELVDSRTVSVDGDVAWDLDTLEGYAASSGRYIVRIVGANGSVRKPIAVIR